MDILVEPYAVQSPVVIVAEFKYCAYTLCSVLFHAAFLFLNMIV